MSLGSRMKTEVDVYARTAESDTWTLQATALQADIRRLTASGARRESVLLEPDITHKARVTKHSALIAGRRLREVPDGPEYVIRVVRAPGRPTYQYQVCLLAEAEEATQ